MKYSSAAARSAAVWTTGYRADAKGSRMSRMRPCQASKSIFGLSWPWPLTFDLLTPEVDRFVPLSRGPLVLVGGIKIVCFVVFMRTSLRCSPYGMVCVVRRLSVTDSLLYFENDTRYSHSYNGRRTSWNSCVMIAICGAIFNNLEQPVT